MKIIEAYKMNIFNDGDKEKLEDYTIRLKPNKEGKQYE